MPEPQPIGISLAELAAAWPEGHPRHPIVTQLAETERRRKETRAAILRHPDIAAKLTRPPLGYSFPEQWNGYIPPETSQLSDSEILRSTTPLNLGRPSKAGHRTAPTAPNDSPRRAALLALAWEAWKREHPETEE